MKWLRLYHDTVTDPKWRIVAADSGQPLSAVLAVWMSMLVCASQAKERGTLEGWNDRIVGASTDLRADAVRCIREAMQGLTLDGDRLTGWDKRQRASDDIAERVQRHRKKGKEPDPGGGAYNGHDDGSNVTSRRGNGTVTLQNGDVTLHSGNVTENPLRAQIQTKTSEEDKGGAVCVTSASPPAQAPAHTHTHEAPPVSSETKSGNIVPFAPPGGRQALPVGWVLPDEWRAWAAAAGQGGIESAARRFAVHWRGRVKSADEWREAWELWVTENIERGYGNGAGRYDRQRRANGDLAAVVQSDLPGWFGYAEGGSDG